MSEQPHSDSQSPSGWPPALAPWFPPHLPVCAGWWHCFIPHHHVISIHICLFVHTGSQGVFSIKLFHPYTCLYMLVVNMFSPKRACISTPRACMCCLWTHLLECCMWQEGEVGGDLVTVPCRDSDNSSGHSTPEARHRSAVSSHPQGAGGGLDPNRPHSQALDNPLYANLEHVSKSVHGSQRYYFLHSGFLLQKLVSRDLNLSKNIIFYVNEKLSVKKNYSTILSLTKLDHANHS